MNSERLRDIQSPLKSKYKENPKSAVVTLQAFGKPGEGITCKIETSKALITAGLHPATGGDGLSACSGDMLLEAIVACAGVTFMAVATSLNIKIDDASIKAEGDIDFRGTLAVSKEANVGFQNIRLQFDIKSSEDEEKIKTLIKLTERYCVIFQTLKTPPSTTSSYKLNY